MKKFIFTLLFILCSISFMNAQKIEIEKNFWGYKITQNEKKLTLSNLKDIMKNNAEAYGLIKKAQTNNIISAILGGAGGFLIGYPIGQSLAGRETNWTTAGIGAGLIAIGIPFSAGVIKNTKKAIDVYNNSIIDTSSNSFQPEFTIIANGNGIGLSLNF